MTEQKEINGPAREAITHLKMIAERGPIRMDDPRHAAIHGTSLETIQTIIETGVLIGHSSDQPLGGNYRGAIFAYPTTQLTSIVKRLADQSVYEQLRDQPQASQDQAYTYALAISQRHALLRKLAIPLSDTEANIHAINIGFQISYPEELAPEEDKQYFRARNISDDHMNAAIEIAKQRRGFLLGISSNFLQPGIFMRSGDPGSSDIRINTLGKGLPYQLLSGIQPLGRIEKEYLERLSN